MFVDLSEHLSEHLEGHCHLSVCASVGQGLVKVCILEIERFHKEGGKIKSMMAWFIFSKTEFKKAVSPGTAFLEGIFNMS